MTLAEPTSLASALAQPFVHPIDSAAFSRRQPGAVTCTSCHSAHRGLPEGSVERPAGRRLLSPRGPGRFEFETCGECHASSAVGAPRIGRASGPRGGRGAGLASSSHRSFHPIEAPTFDRSPSTLDRFVGSEMNCSDCHGNNDSSGARGPHGSAVRHLLRLDYVTVDGSPESAEAYALCYDCHDRERVLDGPSFPYHRLHVVDERTACATCHDPHAAASNRALVRWEAGEIAPEVGPSISSGRLEFVSLAPGEGSCYLTCHGVDHAPASYGSVAGVGSPGSGDSGAGDGSLLRDAEPWRPGAGVGGTDRPRTDRPPPAERRPPDSRLGPSSRQPVDPPVGTSR